MTLTLMPITTPDASGNPKPLISYNDGTNNVVAHVLLDSTGALLSPATAGNQATANTSLASIATNTANIPAKGQTIAANSAPVVLASDQTLPLPTGAATAANQSTGNGSLASIATNTANIPAKGSANSAGSTPVVVASDQTAIPVTSTANTSGGTSVYAALGGTGAALLTNSATAVKASAGNLYGVNFSNKSNADAYLQFFDVAAGSVTLGTTVPKISLLVPQGSVYDRDFVGEEKVSFASAITVAATTTATGSGAPSTGVLANIIYK